VDLGNALGAWGDPRREVMTVDGMRFCHVPKGAFWMGSDEYEDEGPAGWVDIPYDFWMGEHPVSNAQFAEFMADGGYGDGRWWSVARAAGVWRGGVVLDEVEKIVFAKLSQAQKTQLELAASERRWSDHRRLLTEARALAYEREERREPADLSGYVSNTTYALFSERLIHLPNHPVVGIGWYDALAFCEWLAERLKTVLPPGHRVTLPSEAEYEKTARGGKVLPGVAVVDARFARPGREVAHEANSMPQRRFSQGDVFEHNKANTAEGAINVTSPLGAYGVNAYGCSDLDGNVRAWTRSLYGDFNYSTGYAALEFRYPYDVTDETRERLSAPKTVTRVVRGGAFVNIQDGARCAYRGRNRPDLRNLSIGFRVCVSPISR
jgi:formylglycine-generating enzyme required for sulfatase activity